MEKRPVPVGNKKNKAFISWLVRGAAHSAFCPFLFILALFYSLIYLGGC